MSIRTLQGKVAVVGSDAFAVQGELTKPANVTALFKSANDRFGGVDIAVNTVLLAAFTDGYSTYAGGKAPVEHFTRTAAKEFGSRGISVTAIGPGPMDTPFFHIPRLGR